MADSLTTEDFRTLSQYEYAGQGAWTTMPPPDKSVYLKIHAQLERILESSFREIGSAVSLDKCLTLGFSPAGGVRGNRPKDLWCAIFPRDAAAYMPQVYLIISHRGAELGFAAAIHPSDFSNQDFKQKLKNLAPRIFDALPDPYSPEVAQLSEKLTRQGGWYFRRKTRLPPKENNFGTLEALLTFLKSAEGKSWGAGAVARYWLPHEFSNGVDLAEEFLAAVTLFMPLLITVKDETTLTLPPQTFPPDLVKSSNSIRHDLERFMEMYPEARARPFATDKDLWSVISSLQQQIKSLPAVARRPTIHVTWSVGQGNWARVPWIAFLDSRITDSTQRGVYGVFLFPEDMSGVYLTFNQGVTEPKKTHGAASGLQLLRENAIALRTPSNDLQRYGFRLDDGIDLRTDGSLGRDYEAATIAYKFYQRGEVPGDAELVRDIEALLEVYDAHVAPKARQGKARIC